MTGANAETLIPVIPDAAEIQRRALEQSTQRPFPTQDQIRQAAGKITEHHPFDTDHPAVAKAVSQQLRLPAEIVEAALDPNIDAMRRQGCGWWQDMLTSADLLEMTFGAEDRWVVEHAIRSGALNAVAGMNKSGKSRLAMALIESMITGQPFLGEFHVVRPVPVWLFASDDSTRELTHLMQDFLVERQVGGVAGDRLRVAVNSGVDITSRRFLRDVADQVKAEREQGGVLPVLIFDSLYNFMLDDDLERAAMKKLYADLKRLCDTTGATVLLIDHSPKAAADGDGSHALIGSQVKGAAVRSGINVKKLDTIERPDGSVVTHVELQHWANSGKEWKRTLEHDGARFTWTQITGVLAAGREQLADDIADELSRAGGEMDAGALVAALGLETRTDRNRMNEVLRDNADRFVVDPPTGRGRKTVTLVAGWREPVSF